jgi:hypothetical protein
MEGRMATHIQGNNSFDEEKEKHGHQKPSSQPLKCDKIRLG